jgi:predicted RNA binding protein YcfA (HicA-like mRNA interferase family)
LLKKIQGTHHIYTKKGKIERISVPVHGNKDIKIGLLIAIMKIADINESEL